jgi:hypothetical protein
MEAYTYDFLHNCIYSAVCHQTQHALFNIHRLHTHEERITMHRLYDGIRIRLRLRLIHRNSQYNEVNLSGVL